MCFSKQPDAPVKTPSYAPGKIDQFIDVEHKAEDGKVTDLDGKDREEYLLETGIKDTQHNKINKLKM